MSLLCHECNQDLWPTDELPGREGVLLYPVLPSFTWVPGKDGLVQVKKQTPEHRAFCFACIDNVISDARRPILQQIYDCFLAEVAYKVNEQSLEGQMIAMGSATFEEKMSLTKNLSRLLDELTGDCILCGNEPVSHFPHVIGRVLDKAHMQSKIGSISSGSYQMASLEAGETHFNICLHCLENHFPKCYVQLSYDLRGVNKDTSNRKSELHISPAVLKDMENEMGADELNKRLQKLTDIGVDVHT